MDWIFPESWAINATTELRNVSFRRIKKKRALFMGSWGFGVELPPLSSPQGSLSSPVTPERGQAPPYFTSAGLQDIKDESSVGRGGLLLSGPVSQVQLPLWSPAADLYVSKTRSRGTENTPLSLYLHPQPLFPPNLKKGLIVFNNMLSNRPPPSAPPSPPWLELESHMAPCSVPHYCWISLHAAPGGGTVSGF